MKKIRFYLLSYISIDWLKNVMSVWGTLWGATEGIVYLWGKYAEKSIDLSYKLVLSEIAISIVSSIWLSRPFKELSKTIPSTNTKIIVKFGDIWDTKGDLVLGVTRSFTMQVDEVIISSATLHGQYVLRTFANWQEAQTRVNAELARMSNKADDGKYPFGTTVFIPAKQHSAHLSAISDLNEINRASVEEGDYFLAIAKLWESIVSNNSGKDLIVPILGSGLARMSTEKIVLLSNLINTAAVISRQSKIASNIVFVIKPDDVIRGDINIEDIESILSAMNTSMRFSINRKADIQSQMTV